jgi:integrase
VNSRLGTLRAFLRWCHLQGYLPQFDGLRMLDHLRLMKVVVLNPHDALPEHDLPTFLAAAAAPKQRRVRRWRKRPERVPLRKGLDAQTGAYTSQRDHALFLFLHMTGIRPGKEASLVDIGDIIQERAADGSAEWFLDLPAHKTKGLYGARKEQLAPVVVGVLTDYLTATHRTWADTHSPLFLSLRAGPQGDYRLGERGVHFIYRRVLRDWIAQFGGDGRLRLSPHSMRHSFATWLAEGNPELGRLPISVQDLAKVMGHSSIATTQKYIDHANQRDVARRALLSPPPLTTVPMPQDPPAEQDTAATDA